MCLFLIHLAIFGFIDSAQVQTCDCLHMHLAVPLITLAAVRVCVCLWSRVAAIHAASLDC